jgi:hypothetical protein
MLSGFGAGYRGGGTEFLAGIENRKARLSTERRQAAAKDLYEVHLMLKRQLKEASDSGEPIDLSSVNAFGQHRIGAIVKLGGDPTDTENEMALINSDPMAAFNNQRDALMMASSQGEIELQPNFWPQKDTTLVQNLRAAGIREGSPEMRDAILASINKPSTTVNVGDKGPLKAAEKLAELQVKRISTAIADGEAAEETLASVHQLRGIDVQQGGSVPFRAAMADAFASVGIDAQALFDVDLANIQAFNSVNLRLVNQVLNQAKGPQTEGDAQRAVRTLTKLGNRPEANAFVLDTLQANSLRKIERSDFLQASIDNGNPAKVANAEWNKFKRETPMLSNVGKVARNGIPVYFFQFKEQARANRPDVSDAEIVEAWRSANK